LAVAAIAVCTHKARSEILREARVGVADLISLLDLTLGTDMAVVREQVGRVLPVVLVEQQLDQTAHHFTVVKVVQVLVAATHQ
jgi:hypothetical protein